MSHPLSHEEHLQVLGCIHELHRCRSLADFPQHALRALGQLIPTTFSAFNEVNTARGRLVAVADRVVPDFEKLITVWERYSDQHPLVRYVVETGDGQAVKLSDFLSESAYHELDLYRAVFSKLGTEDQLSLTIRSDAGVILAFSFNRDRRNFTEGERVMLNLVRPHVLQAYANAEELTGHVEEKSDLQTALRETGHGLIALDARGSAAHATPGAFECLERYFPGAVPAATVPAPVSDWLASDAHTAFTLHTPDARLILRSPSRTERRLVLVSEERYRRVVGSERLTARETEVLTWLAQGKANAEIAAILAIAPGTVKQHVQSILAKLGVENRTAATVVAREQGLLGPTSAGGRAPR